MDIFSRERTNFLSESVILRVAKRNHVGHDGTLSMDCSKSVAKRVLNRLIDAKIRDLLERESVVASRMFTVLRHFWIRGLEKRRKTESFKTFESVSIAHTFELERDT